MDLKQHPVVQRLLSLHLPCSDYVVAGSGPLLAHGLKESVGDLDIVARGKAWDLVSEMEPPQPAPSGSGSMVLLFGGQIEVFDKWLPGTCVADELIDEAELIQDIPFCPLPRVLDWKQGSVRKKDHADAQLILNYLESHQQR